MKFWHLFMLVSVPSQYKLDFFVPHFSLDHCEAIQGFQKGVATFCGLQVSCCSDSCQLRLYAMKQEMHVLV